MQRTKYKFIICGGGTGGHVFPAIAIGKELRKRYPGSDILFVGALGRLEMQKVPDAGFEIVGLPVNGFIRKVTFRNVSVIINLIRSLLKSKKIIRDFKPDIAVGVGGYASGPILRAASSAGIPVVLQEQNSYAGVTNKLLAKKAAVICVAYDNMQSYFPADKIIITGNPVRQDITSLLVKKEESLLHFGLDRNKKVLLVLGGSLGARTLNQVIAAEIDKIIQSGIQLIWQCGKLYYENLKEMVTEKNHGLIHLHAFIDRMDLVAVMKTRE